jgi:exopolysaccharide biosynthesis polyprenyl glycosylphosphotransferase
MLAEKIEKHPEYGLHVVGFVDRDDRVVAANGDSRLIGSTDDLPELVKAYGAQRVAIAFSTDSHDQTLSVIRSMQDTDVQIDIVPRMFEVLGTNAQLHTIEGVPLVGLPRTHLSGSSRFLKRSFDVAASSLGLVLLAPMFLAVAVAIKLDTRGPVFFRQQRIGYLGKPFLCWKFRTMRVNADPGVHQSHLDQLIKSELPMTKMDFVGDPRLIPLGPLLRASGLDELPQLINVIRGEMSLVGPRPCLPYEYEIHLPWQRQRFDTLPGLTGLWQVSGKNKTTFTEMVRLDIRYARNRSLWLDIRIMARTVFALATQIREVRATKSRSLIKTRLQGDLVRAEN